MPNKNEPQEKSERFLTFSEVQDYLGVKSRKTVLKYIKNGELAAFKLGGTRWRISQADVDHFLAKQRGFDSGQKAA